MIAFRFEPTKQPKTLPPTQDLGFGKHFTDHMLLVDCSSQIAQAVSDVDAEGCAWHSPRILPYGALPLDPAASVLHYGQALFEGLKAYRGDDGQVRLFRPEMNWKRLQAGADRLCMKAPPLKVFIDSLLRFCQIEDRWIPKAPGTALYLRPTLIGTGAFLGVRPSKEYLFYLIGSPVGAYYGEGAESVKIKVEQQFIRAAPGGIGAAKTGGNYAASLKAALVAKQQGYAQVLWLDGAHKEVVEEVGTMNVFFKMGDKVYTPPLNDSILPGVTRDSVIQLLGAQNVEVVQRALKLDEIREGLKSGQLSEIFGTGTAASISPVSTLGIDGQQLQVGQGQVGPLSRQLLKQLTDLQYGRCEDTWGWTLPVPQGSNSPL